MGGFIALYVTACLNLGNPGSCVSEFVTDSTQNQMTMTECLGVEGLYSAKEFVEKHPLYHTWQFKGWSAARSATSRPRKGGRHEPFSNAYGSTQGPEQSYAGTDRGTETIYVAWKGP